MPELEYIDGLPVYEPDGQVLWNYIDDQRHVVVIRGPLGSGTSTASCQKIWKLATEQKPGPDGKRRSRWGVVRNTYPQLKDTTMKTWLDWFKEEIYGKVLWSRPMHHHIEAGDVILEVFFLALDDQADVKLVRSLEVTGWWFNEVEFIPKIIFDECESRTGRYPAMKDGGCSWDGVIADMNTPNEDNWILQMTGDAPLPDEMPEEEKALMVWPPEWGYHVQPSALLENKDATGKVIGYSLNPNAENLKWLKQGYYEQKMLGKSAQWIRTRLMNIVSFITDGDPVWTNVKETHFSKVSLPFRQDREVIVSVDAGRARPCAIIAQEIGDRIQIQREFRRYNSPAPKFAPELKSFLEQNYRGARVRFTGDPKGFDKGQATDDSYWSVFESYGMKVTPPVIKMNQIDLRVSAVSDSLERNRILVAPECTTLRHALMGKYAYKKLDTGEAEPIKDKFSDVADCLQYLCLFLGEGRRMVGLEAVQVARPAKVFKGMKTMRRVVS